MNKIKNAIFLLWCENFEDPALKTWYTEALDFLEEVSE